MDDLEGRGNPTPTRSSGAFFWQIGIRKIQSPTFSELNVTAQKIFNSGL
ncbi:hypothetical protein Cal7507_2650 [Calothrix sp. PCC 7507]|nr:hypothetical protein Cal7507_2650 [Calothrix sp. PCC 7507]